MVQSEEQYNKQRLKTAYVSTVVSISLVLYMLGLIGMIVMSTEKLSDYFKENIIIRVIMKENTQEANIQTLQQELENVQYAKSVAYITKEKAAIDLQKDLGEDFINLLGYNPLLPSLVIRVKANYAKNQNFQNIENELKKNEHVKDVYYHKSLLYLVNENMRKITLFIFGFSILLFIIAFALINNTIRLAVYSKRFLIRSMQLVGATQGFIRKPFLIKGIAQGAIGSLIAIALLLISQYLLCAKIPGMKDIQDINTTIILFVIVIGLGIFTSWIATFFAIRKYLRIKTDYLYFY